MQGRALVSPRLLSLKLKTSSPCESSTECPQVKLSLDVSWLDEGGNEVKDEHNLWEGFQHGRFNDPDDVENQDILDYHTTSYICCPLGSQSNDTVEIVLAKTTRILEMCFGHAQRV